LGYGSGVPLAGGAAWFKACGPVQAFEPRAWLLVGDAGAPIADFGNPPELWLALLPRFAELQRGEAAHAGEHLHNGVPDLRVETLPGR
jgi:hypothetical protein